MSDHSEVRQFGIFLRGLADTHSDRLVARIKECGPNYTRVAEHDLADSVKRTFLSLAVSIEQDDMDQLAQYGREIGLRRARDNFTLQEMLNAVNVFRNFILECLDTFVERNQPWTMYAARRLEDFLHVFYDNFIGSVGEALEQIRGELAEQVGELETQRDVIRELGAPIMPVHEGVLVLPLVGAIDSNRAVQIMENLLESITRYQADMVIIDITGVPTVDTSVANYILQTARAANLIGARIILVGIGAEIAQTIVQLGVDLSTMVTLANLQEGLEYAYRQLGYTIR